VGEDWRWGETSRKKALVVVEVIPCRFEWGSQSNRPIRIDLNDTITTLPWRSAPVDCVNVQCDHSKIVPPRKKRRVHSV
jgi:hypothetical protein